MPIQKTISALEGFNPDRSTISVIREVFISRARQYHTSQIEVINRYPQVFDEAEKEGLLTDCARVRLAVRRAIERIRAAEKS